MTREFNKQRRDDSRPSFRDKPSGRGGEERSPHSTRPRLSRETVDRAWESGAQHQHADYRPRNNQRQSPRWRDNQQSEHSPSHRGPGNNRSYNHRQDNRWDNPRQNESQGYQGPRSRSFDTDRRSTDDQRFRNRRSYSDGQNSSSQSFRDNSPMRSRDFHNSSPDQGQYRGRNQEHGNRRDFDRNTGYSRNNDREGRSLRNEQRSGQEFQRPRWQDRSPRQNEHREPERFSRRLHHEEHFEGDYERFDHTDAPRRPARPANRPFQGKRAHENESEERHVTRLPGGRVLKGPRPVQRRNAQFWTDIAEDTDNLVTHIHAPSTDAPTILPTVEDTEEQGNRNTVNGKERRGQTEVEALSEEDRAVPPVKAKRRAVARGSKADTAQRRATGPRPSQRGFKWPTP